MVAKEASQMGGKSPHTSKYTLKIPIIIIMDSAAMRSTWDVYVYTIL